MSNLLHTLKELVTNQLVTSISKNFGAKEAQISKGLDYVIPTLLQSISNSPSESYPILDELFRKAGNQDQYLLNLIDGLEHKHSSVPLQIGTGLADLTLGNFADRVASYVSKSTGLSVENSHMLNRIGASLVTFFLGKKMINNYLSFDQSLASLKRHKKDYVSLIPEDLNTIVNSTSEEEYRPKRHPKMKQGKNNWLLPVILFGLAGIGFWYWLMGYNYESEKTIDITSEILDTAGKNIEESLVRDNESSTSKTMNILAANEAGGKLDESGNWITVKGEPITIKLAGGTEIQTFKNSLEDKMYNFIQDPTAVSSNAVWFNIEDLIFESGKSSLKNASVQQLTNLSEILKSYPEVKIKLGGYTDNTGDSAKNVRLSDQRARTVYNMLIQKGVSKSSFAEAKPYEGFGPQFPIAENDTPEGRAQNRRIALSIRAK